MFFALIYLLLRRVIGSIAGSSREQMNAEVELVVLRHQLMDFKRQVDRPRLRRRDHWIDASAIEMLHSRASATRARTSPPPEVPGPPPACGGARPLDR